MTLKNNSIVNPNVKFLGLSKYAGKKLHYHKKKCWSSKNLERDLQKWLNFVSKRKIFRSF